MSKGVIKKVAGPLVIAQGMRDANMFDVVRVSEQRLIGEIIEMHGDEASIQVYEETSGLGPGGAGRVYGSAHVRRAWTGADHEYLRWDPETSGRYHEDLRKQSEEGSGSAVPEAESEMGVCPCGKRRR